MFVRARQLGGLLWQNNRHPHNSHQERPGMQTVRRVVAENTSVKGLLNRRAVLLLPETTASHHERPGNQLRVSPCLAGSQVQTFPSPYHSSLRRL